MSSRLEKNILEMAVREMEVAAEIKTGLLVNFKMKVRRHEPTKAMRSTVMRLEEMTVFLVDLKNCE